MISRMADIRLVDAGDGRRLEQLGPRLVDRPASLALEPRREPERWSGVDLRFHAGAGWSGPTDPSTPWLAEIQGLRLELRATTSGGIGLYPEHAANLGWLEQRVADRLGRGFAGDRPQVLNLFAHTGLATLAAARAGAAVAHVDAARSAVSWARRNARHSGLDERPIRWLVDDALAFVEREARRGRRYEGLIVDPPTFGQGRRGRGATAWRIDEGLARLLAACASITSPTAFVLVTAHTAGLEPESLGTTVADAFGEVGGRAEIVRQRLVAESGAVLDLGWAIRLEGPAANDPRDGAP
jgi:23S rRNA (cytosine1962-C5)-methyltransferase